MHLPDPLALLVSIVLMAATIVAAAAIVLSVRPLPWGRALLIATVSNGLGKLLVSGLHQPAAIAYGVPTLAFLILSAIFFRPRPLHLLAYWLLGFTFYLLIHVVIARAFDWTFMFPFWVP